jgi:hypothetical protein
VTDRASDVVIGASKEARKGGGRRKRGRKGEGGGSENYHLTLGGRVF